METKNNTQLSHMDFRLLRSIRNKNLRWFMCFFIGAALLTACASTTTSAPTNTPLPTRTPPQLGPSSTPEPSTPTPTPQPALPTALPIPPVSDADWTRGPADAPVTLMVYSDFQ
ncbi:MAG: hypothetical protein GTO18_01050 [Anaerolineales bacterium]|nr:hypothetical protein [Anaerolineales bacterium]